MNWCARGWHLSHGFSLWWIGDFKIEKGTLRDILDFGQVGLGRAKSHLQKKFTDRAISYQRCDESTKYDIHLSFSAVSSRLTHRKRLIQRALDSRDPGEPF